MSDARERAATVRRALPDDAARLAELSRQLGYPATEAEIAGRLGAILAHADHAVFVTEAAGAVAGWIQVSLSRHVESEPFAEIDGLVVDEGSRGHGLGPLLVRAGESWALARGAQRLRVRSNVARADARRFYEREGFREVKRQRVLDRPIVSR